MYLRQCTMSEGASGYPLRGQSDSATRPEGCTCQGDMRDGWVLDARQINVELETVTPTGRCWNADAMLWEGEVTGLGERIRQVRKARGMTQQQIAEALGVA